MAIPATACLLVATLFGFALAAVGASATLSVNGACRSQRFRSRLLGSAGRHDRRAPPRLHFARQAGARNQNGLTDKQLPPYFLSYSVAMQAPSPFARSTARWPTAQPTTCAWPTCRSGWAIRKLDNTHGNHRGSAVQQPPAAAGRRSRGPRARAVAGHQHRLRHRARQLSAREDRSPGARQGRRHLARLQPGGAAGFASASRRRRSSWTAPHGSSGCVRSPGSSATIPTFTRTW